jgi:6-pyruvoyltetrahydropterin/6-carboxytetrahydropterin synthase
MRYELEKSFMFESAHRLLGHKGKCAGNHGHNWVFQLRLGADQLNPLGMVIDFYDLKSTIGKFIEENVDHNTLCNAADTEYVEFARKFSRPGCEPLVLSVNPTSENVAEFLRAKAVELLEPFGVTVLSATIHETAGCSATSNKP